jgi:hypothetical protein
LRLEDSRMRARRARGGSGTKGATGGCHGRENVKNVENVLSDAALLPVNPLAHVHNRAPGFFDVAAVMEMHANVDNKQQEITDLAHIRFERSRARAHARAKRSVHCTGVQCRVAGMQLCDTVGKE